MSEFASSVVSATCIFGSMISTVVFLALVYWPRETSFQQKQILNPETQSWYHLPDPDEPFPMLQPLDEAGKRQSEQKYRDYINSGLIT